MLNDLNLSLAIVALLVMFFVAVATLRALMSLWKWITYKRISRLASLMPRCSLATQEGITDNNFQVAISSGDIKRAVVACLWQIFRDISLGKPPRVVDLKRLKKLNYQDLWFGFRKLRRFRAIDRERRATYSGAVYEVNDHRVRAFFRRDYSLVSCEDYETRIGNLLCEVVSRGKITVDEIGLLREWNEYVFEDPSCPDSRYTVWSPIHKHLAFDDKLSLVSVEIR